MSIIIPPNLDPYSVSVKTASYQIPAGSYAIVTANVLNGGTFTVDGATALSSTASTAATYNSVSNSGGGSITLYTVPSGYKFEGFVRATSNVTSGSISVAGLVYLSVTGAGDSGYVSVNAGSGAVISYGGDGQGYILGVAEKEGSSSTSDSSIFYLPPLTTINGTGTWYATVSLYYEIT